MVTGRRQTLQAIGTTALATLAGCTTDILDSDQSQQTYSLNIDTISASPVEHALFDPDDDALFGDPSRTALGDILPNGRYTTYGYEPLPDSAYVEHEGQYYQTTNVITGRKQMERTLVRVEALSEKTDVPDDAVLVDELNRPTARVVKILHSNAVTDGEGSSTELLRGDYYVLRRPVERKSRLAAGELDGRVVTMTESGSWAYRLDVTHERITETAHTALAVEVANSREQFREVVFGSRIDTELAPEELSEDVRDLLENAVQQDAYEESTPVSETFKSLLAVLGLEAIDTMVNGRLLWYDGEYYRYALYINDE